MATRNESDQDTSHNKWIRSLTEARRNCREVLYKVERDPGTDPEACFDPAESARDFHAAVLDYHALVQPYRDHPDLSGAGSSINDDSLWGEPIENPETGDPVQFEAPVVVDGELARETHPVKLWGFADYFSQRVLEWREETYDEKHGTVMRKRRRRVWIPPKVGRAVYHQLNRCVEQIGFAAEMDTTVDEEGDPF